MFAARRVLAAFLAVAVVAVALLWSGSGLEGRPAAAKPPGEVGAAAAMVVRALRERRAAMLATIAHPAKGVRFSPSAYVDAANDVVLSPAEIRRLWSDRRVRRWGHAEGSGEPIRLTAAQYVARYTLPRRPLAPHSISVDRDQTRGTTTNNAATAYPRGRRVEYYWKQIEASGNPEFDWLALRMVFEPIGGRWFLVGIIHDRWSP